MHRSNFILKKYIFLTLVHQNDLKTQKKNQFETKKNKIKLIFKKMLLKYKNKQTLRK